MTLVLRAVAGALERGGEQDHDAVGTRGPDRVPGRVERQRPGRLGEPRQAGQALELAPVIDHPPHVPVSCIIHMHLWRRAPRLSSPSPATNDAAPL